MLAQGESLECGAPGCHLSSCLQRAAVVVSLVCKAGPVRQGLQLAATWQQRVAADVSAVVAAAADAGATVPYLATAAADAAAAAAQPPSLTPPTPPPLQ